MEQISSSLFYAQLIVRYLITQKIREFTLLLILIAVGRIRPATVFCKKSRQLSLDFLFEKC